MFCLCFHDHSNVLERVISTHYRFIVAEMFRVSVVCNVRQIINYNELLSREIMIYTEINFCTSEKHCIFPYFWA